MKIWVDLATPPQVLFFTPLIQELEQRDHEVQITVRDFSQTVGLAEEYGLSYTLIGHHGGRGETKKLVAILRRAKALREWAREYHFELALSHNSYAQILAARSLHIPTVTCMDYEHQPSNHLAFRLANKVIVPQHFPERYLRKFGARNYYKYNGIKEQVYLSSFRPDERFSFPEWGSRFQQRLSETKRVVVTLRPPADFATYHRFENPLFRQVLRHLFKLKDVVTIVLSRTPEQRQNLIQQNSNIIIPSKAVDGRNLLFFSDLMVGAGGTMNREAAVLGTPVYTMFAGKMGAIDRWLVETGRMCLLKDEEDFPKIEIGKKRYNDLLSNPELVSEITEAMINL